MRTAPTLLLFTTFVVVIPRAAIAQEPLRPTLQDVDDDEGADVFGAFADSLKLLLTEHGTRIAFQRKTRRELGGNFWTDYRRSVRVPRQWEDSDAWWVNYIGHPIHGAAAGYIWLDHDRSAPKDINFNREYWSSRARAMAWAGAYSLQFEIGPLSEASIGNVGMRPETTGWVDHVITPIGALGLIAGEDAMDRYLVRWVERRLHNRPLRIALRVFLNPGRALSNTSTGRAPWHRPDRQLSWR